MEILDPVDVNRAQMNFTGSFNDVVKQTYQPLNTASAILDFTLEDITELFDAMTIEEQAEFELLLRNSPPRALMPHQFVPDAFSANRWWETMLLLGGRGVGKTVTGAFAAREHLRHYGRRARVGVGAPTQADARDTAAEGESGLITMFPNEFSSYNRSMGEARHIGGGMVKFMGTEKPKRWNGGNWSMLWFDELALCNQIAWDDANLALRLKGPNGEHPYSVCTTTPKNRKFVKALASAPTTYVPQYIDPVTLKRRIPTTFDNGYLPERRVDWLRHKYGGTRQGQQELYGLFTDDIAGAMFQRSWFLYHDHNKRLPYMIKTILAIDPAGSMARAKADDNSLSDEQRANQEKNAETALAVIGLGVDGVIYVLQVIAGAFSPGEWGMLAVELFHEFKCSKIVAESNFGGMMVDNTIRTVDAWSDRLNRQMTGRYLPIEMITASKGKHIRAQPVATLYEQNLIDARYPKIIHATMFPEAEAQMCAFVSSEENEGADMVDAVVWGVLHATGMAAQPMNNFSVVLPAKGQKLYQVV